MRKSTARCGARTRRNTPCGCKALANGRCRLHGGLSTGPKTPEGRARADAARQEGNRRWREAGSPGIQARKPALTPRQALFRRFYLSCGNAALAAELAGYAQRSAQQIGSWLTRHHPLIQRDAAMLQADGAPREIRWRPPRVKPRPLCVADALAVARKRNPG